MAGELSQQRTGSCFPEADDGVLATGGNQLAVRGEGQSVYTVGMGGKEVGLLACFQVPQSHAAVLARGGEVLAVRRIGDGRHARVPEDRRLLRYSSRAFLTTGQTAS